MFKISHRPSALIVDDYCLLYCEVYAISPPALYQLKTSFTLCAYVFAKVETHRVVNKILLRRTLLWKLARRKITGFVICVVVVVNILSSRTTNREPHWCEAAWRRCRRCSWSTWRDSSTTGKKTARWSSINISSFHTRSTWGLTRANTSTNRRRRRPLWTRVRVSDFHVCANDEGMY